MPVHPLHYTGKRADDFYDVQTLRKRKILGRDGYDAAVRELNKREQIARKQAETNDKKRKDRVNKMIADAAAAKRAAAYLREAAETNPLADIHVDTPTPHVRAPRRMLQKGQKYYLRGRVIREVEFEGRGASYTKELEKSWQHEITPKHPMTEEQAEQLWLKSIPVYESGQLVSQTTADFIVDAAGVLQLEDVPMGREVLRYPTLATTMAATKENSCVIDYILSEFAKPDSRMKTYTRAMLEERLGTGKVTTRAIIEWASSLERQIVNVTAISPMLEVFASHVTEEPRVYLVFVVNDGHCYPITDPELRRQATTAGFLGLDDIRCGRTEILDAVYHERLETNANEQIKASLTPAGTLAKTVILPVQRLDTQALDVANRTGLCLERFSYSSSELVGFVHPETGQVVLAGRDYRERKGICDKLYGETQILDFRFENQGYGAIGSAFLRHNFADIPASAYSSDYKQVLESYPVNHGYYTCALSDSERRNAAAMAKIKERCISVDIKRAYTSILLHNTEPFAVFGAFDHIAPVVIGSATDLTPGEYYIRRTFYMGDGTIQVSRGFYPSVLVRYALEAGYISGEDITYGIRADRQLPADTFKAFAQHVTEKFGPEAKHLVNYTVGCWGSIYHTHTRGAVTSQEEMVDALRNLYPNCETHSLGDMHIVQTTTRTMKDSGDGPLHRHVIASGMVKLDKMVKALELKGEQIVAYNTDSVKFMGAYNKEALTAKEDCKPGEYHLETKCFLAGYRMEELPVREAYAPPLAAEVQEVEEANAASMLETGGLITGMPGCGKTYLIRHTLWDSLSEDQRDKTAVVAYTNAGAENLRCVGLPAATFDSLLWDGEGIEKKRLKKYERIILDEFSMLPPDRMAALQHAHNEYGLKVIVVGDSDQCTAPVDNWLRYDTNPLFLRMCGNRRLHMQYKPGCARYDEALYQAILKFKQSRTLEGWSASSVLSYNNLCFTNAKRHEINAECLGRWLTEKGLEPVEFGGRLVAVGLDMVVYDKPEQHAMRKELIKMQAWTITKVEPASITLTRGEQEQSYDATTFSEVFDYPFCLTTHKAQGITIHGPFNIHEVDKMNHEILYTAISRGTSLAHVHLTSAPEGVVYPAWRHACIEVRPQRIQSIRGRIYRITTEAGRYYGQTVQTLEERFAEHKAKPTNARMREALTGPAAIELVEEFVCTAEQLNREEIRQIRRAEDRGEVLLNEQHTRRKAAENARKTAAKAASKPKHIGIGVDNSKRRFEVRVQHRNVPQAEQVRRFPWGASRPQALKEAEAWRDELLKKYFS